jgi:hypothetical protein
MMGLGRKRTKNDIIAELGALHKEATRLRARVQELEREPTIADQLARGIRLLAVHFADSVALRTTDDSKDRQLENTVAMEEVLRILARSHRSVIVLAHDDRDGEGRLTCSVLGAIGDPLRDHDFCQAVDRAREMNARQVVMRHGAADSLALVRRMAQQDGVQSGKMVTP